MSQDAGLAPVSELTTTLVVTSAQTQTAAVATALADIERERKVPTSGEIVVVGDRRGGRNRSDTADLVTGVLRSTGQAVRTMRPLSPLARARSLVPGAGTESWISVSISGRGARLDEVRIPRGLVNSLLVVAVDLRDERSPIGILARHVHPLESLAAGGTGSRSSLAADLTLAFSPRLVVVTGRVGSLEIAAATTDLIAGELVTRALQDADDERGPWEDPLVQRATELQIGVTWPDEIRLLHRWAGPPGFPQAGALAALVDRLGLRLGLPSR